MYRFTLLSLLFCALIFKTASAQNEFLFYDDNLDINGQVRLPEESQITSKMLSLLNSYKITLLAAKGNESRLLPASSNICLLNQVKSPTLEKVGLFSQAYRFIYGPKIYLPSGSNIADYLNAVRLSGKKPNLSSLLQRFSHLKLGVGIERDYPDGVDKIIKDVKYQKSIYRRSTELTSTGLIAMLLKHRVDYILEYPREIRRYFARIQKKNELDSYPVAESRTYRKLHLLCSRSEQGKSLIAQANHFIGELLEKQSYQQAILHPMEKLSETEKKRLLASLTRQEIN